MPSIVFGEGGIKRYISLSDVAADAEKEYIIKVLKTTNGNKTKAAEMLRISRKNLWEKMNAYGIDL